MYTRKQYLDGEVSHRDYYGQFVQPWIKEKLTQRIGLERILKSTDPHLNDISLREWDRLVGYQPYPIDRMPREAVPPDIAAMIKQAGDTGGVSASDMTCIYKEAARQIQEFFRGEGE